VAVILVGIAIGLFIYLHFEEHIVNDISSLFRISYRGPVWMIIFVGYWLSIFVLLWNWFRDALWIIRSSQEEFTNYLKELNDEKTPELERRWIMRHIFKKRLSI